MSNSLKTLFFAAGMCLVCSLLLTAASSGLQKYQEQNIILDRQKNILKSVGLYQDDLKYSSDAIKKLYVDSIKELWTDDSGEFVDGPRESVQSLPIYLHLENNNIKNYIVPINSRGLWGTIRGYLAIADDGETVTGFTVYSHSETPGLGGEIEKRWFQKNFVGKKIVNRDGDFASINIAKGRVEDVVPAERQANYVDGISGATLTGKYLTEGFREILGDYEPVAVKFRYNRVGLDGLSG